MCSTPRPKRSLKSASAGATTNDTILSGLTAQKRAIFVQRANQADDRRYVLQKQAELKKCENNHRFIKQNTLIKKTQEKPIRSWSFWLIEASLKEIVMMLFFGKSY